MLLFSKQHDSITAPHDLCHTVTVWLGLESLVTSATSVTNVPILPKLLVLPMFLMLVHCVSKLPELTVDFWFHTGRDHTLTLLCPNSKQKYGLPVRHIFTYMVVLLTTTGSPPYFYYFA